MKNPISNKANGIMIFSNVFAFSLFPVMSSYREKQMVPPSKTGRGNKFKNPRFKLIAPNQNNDSFKLVIDLL